MLSAAYAALLFKSVILSLSKDDSTSCPSDTINLDADAARQRCDSDG
jgi:hypothetical protein